MKISIIILTYNRKKNLIRQLNSLEEIKYNDVQKIIVDNASSESYEKLVKSYSNVILLRNDTNLGAVGRNVGIRYATGDIIITIDDDVYGINDDSIHKLINYMKQKDLAAVNFKILEEKTGRIANWCHPYDEEKFHGLEFETSCISEGAVAFRRTAIIGVGAYPDYFFISHEGPDLAFRLINSSWRVIYSPDISLIHSYEEHGRPGWRRYYYDTRNQLWLVLRNYPFFYGIKKLFICWVAMAIYSIRDGYIFYWARGIIDSIKGVPRALSDRIPPSGDCMKKIYIIEKTKPGILAMAKKRLFTKGVKI